MKYVVTGTSSGLGAEIVNKLLIYGEVTGISRKIVKSEGEQAIYNYTHISADLSVPGSANANSSLVKELRKNLKDDTFSLVINAASFYSGSVRLSADQRHNMFCINIFSVMDLIESLRELKLKRVIFVNSISGLVGQADQHEYSASKHALMGYIRSLIKESVLGPFDIMCINPGGINTNLWQEYPEVDVTNFLDPEMIANIVVTLLNLQQRVFIPEFVILPGSDI